MNSFGTLIKDSEMKCQGVKNVKLDILLEVTGLCKEEILFQKLFFLLFSNLGD